MLTPTAYMNWSGGKDSALALHYMETQQSYVVECLLTSIDAELDRISMHGVHRCLLEAQAASIGLPLFTLELPSQPEPIAYENLVHAKLSMLKAAGFTGAVFGDIFLEDLRSYREGKLDAFGMRGIFPLWKQDTLFLVKEFVRLGFKAIIVCVNDKYLDNSFCGRLIDASFIADLPPGVDPCGENGEYHSFVFDGPIFNKPVRFNKGQLFYRQYPAPLNSRDNNGGNFKAAEKPYGFWYCDLHEGDAIGESLPGAMAVE